MLRILGKGPTSWDHSIKTSGDQHCKHICTGKKHLLGGGCDQNTLHTCMKHSKNKNYKKTPKPVPPLKIIILLQYHASQKQFLVSTCTLVYTSCHLLDVLEW